MVDKLRVLYVDDEPILLKTGKFYLERKGEFAVDTLTSAIEALEQLKTEHYDAIISDYQMSGMDGIEFLKKIRASGNTFPFILFTGKGREEVVITALNEGADFYHQKGGEPEPLFAELAHKIRQAVQHRRADVRIRDHERRETDIINFLPDATFAIDTNGVVIAWNHAMEEMCGIKAAEILGKGNYEYSIPLYKERRPILVDLILHDEPSIAAKYPSLKRDGQTLIAEATSPDLYNGRGATIWFIAAPLYDNQGEVVGAIESIRDITERKQQELALLKNTEELHASYEEITATEEELRANLDELTRQEQELKESREKYRSLFSDSRDGIVMVDEQGRFLDANPVYCAMLGYSVEELRTISFPNITPEKWQAWEGEEIWNRRLMKDGYTGIYEKEYVRKDGSIFPVELQAFTVFDTNRNIKYVWGTVRDITERKQQELELLKNAEELHASYEEITATEEELRANLDQLTRQELELRESKTELSDIIEFLPDATFVLDRQGVVIAWNHAIEEMTGISKENMIGQGDHAYMIPFYGDRRKHLVDLIDLEDEELQAKYQQVTRKGNTLYAETFAPVLYGGKGAYVWVTGSPLFDLQGNRIGAIESIRDITERKRAEEALRESDARQRAMIANITDVIAIIDTQGIIRYKSENIEKIFGWKPEELVGLSFRETAHPEDVEQITNVFLKLIEDENASTTVEYRYKLKDGSFHTIHLTAKNLIHDPTINGVLVNYHDITEHKLAEDTLLKVNRKLNVLSQLTRQDLTTQIFVLNSYLEMAKTHATGHDGIIKNIESSERTVRSIKEITEFTKDYQNMGEKPPKYQNVKLSFLFGLSHISIDEIRHSLETENLEIFADPLLEKAFQGLLENSVKHGGHVSLIRVSHTITPDEVTIVFEDDGVGISEEKKERIFLRGEGAHASVRGLFFVREILDITGITITETGEPGKGARFEMAVPKGAWRITVAERRGN